MNAFRLYVGFTPSTATVIVLETSVLLHLCRKVLTSLLQLTPLPTATEHGSHEGLAEQLWCWWRTSFILEDLGIYEQQHQINTRSTPGGDWKMKAEGRQKNRTKLFLPPAFTPSSHPISTIFTTSNGPLPYPPLTFSSHQVSTHTLGKENPNCISCEQHRESQRNKNKQKNKTTTKKREDWLVEGQLCHNVIWKLEKQTKGKISTEEGQFSRQNLSCNDTRTKVRSNMQFTRWRKIEAQN